MQTNLTYTFIVDRKKSRKKTYSNTSSASSTISAADMKNIVDKLSMARCRDTTKRTYYCIWHIFNEFIV